MTWLQALVLGILQGFTEFLPISSSGHLAIGGAVLGIDDNHLMFTIVVHAATVLSIITVFRKELLKLIQDLFSIQWNESTQYISKLLLSMIPVGIVGLCFKKQVEEIFGSGLLLVGCMLLTTAVLLVVSYKIKPRERKFISFKDALLIGLAQAVAVLPGLSRSGATISTGILLGNNKEAVTRFSFLMVIIPVLGEAGLDLMKGHFSFAHSSISPLPLMIGFLAAYISGTIACRWMLFVVQKGKLIYFAYYCITIALFAITFHIFSSLHV